MGAGIPPKLVNKHGSVIHVVLAFRVIKDTQVKKLWNLPHGSGELLRPGVWQESPCMEAMREHYMRLDCVGDSETLEMSEP